MAGAKRYVFFLTGVIIFFGVLISQLVSLYFSRPIRRLQEGQIIVLGTDGAWEAHDANGDMFGKQPLMEVVRRCRDKSAGEILDAVIKALNRFRGNVEQEDDVTLLVTKIVSNT